MRYLAPKNSESVNPTDKFIVIKTINGQDWQIVESHRTLAAAMKAVAILQLHSHRNNHGEIFDWREYAN